MTKRLRKEGIGAPEKTAPTGCSRCVDRSGYIMGYAHVMNGVCFRCGGTGTDPTYRDWVFPADWSDAEIDAWHERREAKNARARERASERRREAAMAVWNANVERFPALAAARVRIDEGGWVGEFIFDVTAKARRFEISDKAGNALTEALARVVARDAERAAEEAERGEVEVGDGLTVEGEVVSRKWKDSAYGSTLKFLVKLDNGSKVWGSAARAITSADVGDRVRFVANVEVSDDDASFGFFKRPRKAEVLTASEEGDLIDA